MNGWIKATALVLLASGIVLPEIVGYVRDDYNSYSNYLSELGAVGVPYSYLINFAGFLPVGLAIIILVFALFQRLTGTRWLRTGLVCLLGVSLGYLGAVLFWCDYGCPTDGGIRQGLHNLAALIEYIGAIVGLFCICIGIRKGSNRTFAAVTLAAALTVTIGFFLLLDPNLQQLRGASQRMADYSIFLWFNFAVFGYANTSKKLRTGDA